MLLVGSVLQKSQCSGVNEDPVRKEAWRPALPRVTETVTDKPDANFLHCRLNNVMPLVLLARTSNHAKSVIWHKLVTPALCAAPRRAV